MNLFILDENPIIAAQMQINAHVIKMPSESSNLLLWPFKDAGLTLPNNKSGVEVKLSHKNHPASIWVRENRSNWNWAFSHFCSLLTEYEERYGRDHYATVYCDFMYDNIDKLDIPLSFKMTPFARCFGEFKTQLDLETSDTVEAYRRFYRMDKFDFAKWPSVEKIPQWWKYFFKKVRLEQFIDPSFKNGIYSKRKIKG